MYTQHFFLHNRYYGMAKRGKLFIHGELQAPTGVAAFCPLCCDLWLRAPIEKQVTLVSTMPCEKHGLYDKGINYFLDLPGSLYHEYFEKEFIDALPSELILREFYLELNAFERN